MENTILKNPVTGEQQAPFTVASQVQYDANKNINQKLNEMEEDIANAGKFYSIDTSRILAVGAVSSYTATEDCVLSFTGTYFWEGDSGPTINGVNVYYAPTGSKSVWGIVFLKKGDTFSYANSGADNRYKVFGIK